MPPKNALDVLMRSSTRSGPRPAKQQRTGEASSSSSSSSGGYLACPVCSRSIPAHFLNLHAASCLEQGHQGRPGQQALPAMSPPHTQPQPDIPSMTHQPAAAPCHPPPPPCDPGQNSPVQQQQQQEQQEQEQLPHVQQQQQQQQVAGRCGAAGQAEAGAGDEPGAQGPPLRNAFTALMQTQRSPAPSPHTFTLELLPGSGWTWTWSPGQLEHTQAAPPQQPASPPSWQWSSTVVMKHPRARAAQAASPAAPARPCPPPPAAPPLGTGPGPGAADQLGRAAAGAAAAQLRGGLQRPWPPDKVDTAGAGEGGRQQVEGGPPWPASGSGAGPPYWALPPSPAPVAAKGGGARAAAAPASTSILLRTNVSPGAGGRVGWEEAGLLSNREQRAGGRWRGSPSLLKSALQKAIRRGLPGPALRLALHLAKDSPGDLLRRLLVISLEDCLLHPALPLLTWLMVAQSKGYELGALHVTALLHFVHQLAAVKVRDYLPPANMRPGQALHSPAEVDQLLPDLPQEGVLVKCLLMRAAWGGMAGDVELLRGYAAYWAARFKGQAVPPPSLPPPSPNTQLPGPRPLGSSQQQPSVARGLPAMGGQGEGQPPSTAQPQGVGGDPGGASPGEGSSRGGSCLDSSASRGGGWRRFLEGAYCRPASSPPQACGALQVGALQLADVPLAAMDFHVSDILPHLLALPQVREAAAAVTRRCWGREAEAEWCLRTAMWLFSSGVNVRQWLQLLPDCAAPAGDDTAPAVRGIAPAAHGVTPAPAALTPFTHYEARELLADLERDAANRDRLEPLWRVAAPAAKAYAAAAIAKRFRDP